MPKDLTNVNPFELVERPDPSFQPPLPQQYRPAFDDDVGEPRSGNLRRYLDAVLRHKWWILVLTLAGTAAGVFAAGRVTPQYRAAATLWIETTSPQAERTGPIRPQELLESSSWIELLRSGVVLDDVVRSQRLFLSTRRPSDLSRVEDMGFEERFAPGTYRISTDRGARTFVLETAAGAVVERGAFGDAVGEELGIRWTPDLSTFPTDRYVEFQIQPPREVANELSEELEAALDRNGNFLRLSLEGEYPERVAGTLTAIVERYVEVAADLKRARLDELVTLLEDQLDYSERRLRNAEMALEDFRVQTVTLPSERSTPVSPGLQITRDPVFDNFFQMRVDLEQVRRDREMITRALGGGGVSTEALGAIGSVQGSAEMVAALEELTQKRSELRALRYRYTDEHPPVRRLLGEIATLENQTIPTLARQVLAELATQETQLQGRIASASAELEQIPPRAIEEARLTRSVESADNLYTTLLRRYEEARLSAASSIPDVRVLDRAVVPREPLRDQKPQIILLAFVGSLGLGILGAILRDRLDPRLRYPDQVTDGLGLTILAGIPNLNSRRGFFGRDNSSQAQEAFRTLRLGLMHAYGSAGPLVTTVTSPGPGDGKSFVSANLGRAFSDIGKRTLVIDGDTRRGRLHDLLKTERKPGLIDVLRNGGAPVADCVRATTHANLFLLPSGSRIQEGPELLSSKEMRDLILDLRSEFDVIIVDSPPLGAGIDPFALGTLTGSMILVLRTGETDRTLADAKLELLSRLPIRLLGAVLNGVPAAREYRYYAYTPGYETHDEDEAATPALIPH